MVGPTLPRLAFAVDVCSELPQQHGDPAPADLLLPECLGQRGQRPAGSKSLLSCASRLRFKSVGKEPR